MNESEHVREYFKRVGVPDDCMAAARAVIEDILGSYNAEKDAATAIRCGEIIAEHTKLVEMGEVVEAAYCVKGNLTLLEKDGPLSIPLEVILQNLVEVFAALDAEGGGT